MVNALYVSEVARVLEANVILRVEDHDRVRCRHEFEVALLEDLHWLGFITADTPFVRQSERDDVYRAALDTLRGSARVYACDCSRADIRRRAASSPCAAVSGEERYDGFCRTRGLAESAGRGLRVELDAGGEPFVDLLLGAFEQVPHDQCGDLLLRDRDGHWTYQFAVTVDDLEQGVHLVVRGEDLLDSTGRQIRLGRMLGRDTPARFLHHPLIRKASGEKLSKAGRDTAVRQMREDGDTAAQVLARAAASVGFTASSIDARTLRRALPPENLPVRGTQVPSR